MVSVSGLAVNRLYLCEDLDLIALTMQQLQHAVPMVISITTTPVDTPAATPTTETIVCVHQREAVNAIIMTQ